MRRVYPPTYTTNRCRICGVHLHLCFCAGFKTFSNRTRIVFLQHTDEARKPTNSTRLACHILSNSAIVAWNRVAPPKFDAPIFLLYPAPDAPEIAPLELHHPCTIVIPDGTWAQASRIASVMASTGLEARALPPGALSRWSVRRSKDPARISSAQAAAAILGLAGETEAATSLHAAVAEANKQILAMRGIVCVEPSSFLGR